MGAPVFLTTGGIDRAKLGDVNGEELFSGLWGGSVVAQWPLSCLRTFGGPELVPFPLMYYYLVQPILWWRRGDHIALTKSHFSELDAQDLDMEWSMRNGGMFSVRTTAQKIGPDSTVQKFYKEIKINLMVQNYGVYRSREKILHKSDE